MPIDMQGMTPLLQVFDMPTSVAFYCDILGFSTVEALTDWVWLRRDGIELMLNTRYERDERPAVPDPVRVAAHDDTTLYFACPDVDGAYAYLRERGVPSSKPKNAPYGMRQLYLTDPDGYQICFQCSVTLLEADDTDT